MRISDWSSDVCSSDLLRDLGNSVLVVEHDEEAILTADYVIDMGPAAGVHGGETIAQGTAEHIMAEPASVTGQRSETRRVGTACDSTCRSQLSPYHQKKQN